MPIKNGFVSIMLEHGGATVINIGEPKRTEPNRKELNPINYNNAGYNGDEENAGDDNQNGYNGDDEYSGSFSLPILYLPLFLS